MSAALVDQAVAIIRSGGFVVVADDEDREAEGDIVAAAGMMTAEGLNRILKRARGLLCCALGEGIAGGLDLHVLPGALHDTAFTESIDLREGCTTGISCEDRAACLRRLADPEACSEDFARPGHIFPLVARSWGVLERRGHTEAAVDLCAASGLAPAAAICEILSEDGRMARRVELQRLAEEWGTVFLTVEDIVRWRKRKEMLLQALSSATIPTPHGVFTLWSFSPVPPLSVDALGARESRGPLLLSMGIEGPRVGRGSPFPPPDPSLDGLLVRVHSECVTGDLFGSLRCDCGKQLEEAMTRIGREGRGAVIYLRQEGRGIGLEAKLKAYGLQDGGMDTVDANLAQGLPADARDYWEASQILKALGVPSVRLMTNNPKKLSSLEGWGTRVRAREPIVVGVNEHNRFYLQTKRERFDHALEMEETA